MPPEENKNQETPQQDSTQAEPVIVETPAPVEQPTETITVDTIPKITPEPVPVEQTQNPNPPEPDGQRETLVVEAPVEQVVTEPASPKERPHSAPLPKDSPPTPQTKPIQENTQSQIQEQIIYKTDPNFIQKMLIKARAKIQERKRKKLDKIMTLFEAKPQVMNKDIQKLLRISSATTVRYMNILERENRVKQVGSTGKSVFYTKI